MKSRKPTDLVTDPEACESCGTEVSITRFDGRQVAVTNEGTNNEGDPIYMTHRHYE
jgi:hypothetical protein